MKIRCKPSEDLESSKFVLGNGRKVLNHKQAVAKLISEGDYSVQDAQDKLEVAYDNATSEDPDGEVKFLIPELSPDVKKIFSFFRWFVDVDGSIATFVKNSLTNNTYDYSKDLIKSSMAIRIGGQTLYSMMDEAYKMLARSNSLNFLNLHSGENEDQKILPTLAEYWEKFVKRVWETDSFFCLPEKPVEITTDPKIPSFFYFDDSTLVDAPTPNWDGWLLRMPKSARPVFRAWVYSIFDPVNKGRQAVWLRDNGYSGKSSMLRALGRRMNDGKAVGSISKGSLSDKFGYSTIYGKRLVTYGDAKNNRLLSTEKVHSMLGGDRVQIERKGVDAFSAEIHAKLIVTSNIIPEIDVHERNQITRILYFPLSEPSDEYLRQYCLTDSEGNIVRGKDGVPKYIGGNLDEKLFSEIDAFLYKCREDYEKLCPNRQDIPVPDAMHDILLAECASVEHIHYEKYVEENININAEAQLCPVELQESFQEFMGTKSSQDFANFKHTLAVMTGAKLRKVRLEGKRVRRWCGIELKEISRSGLGI